MNKRFDPKERYGLPSPSVATPRWAAIVLAGDRPRPDPLVAAAHVSCKALVPVGGIPMVLRVTTALQRRARFSHIHLCGPAWSAVEHVPTLAAAITTGQLYWHAPQTGPSASAAAALRAIDAQTPVLLTTADHALLDTDTVDAFMQAATASRADFAVALTAYAGVMAAYPGMRRTALRFGAQAYCGCNLFACLTAQGRRMVEFWQQVEQHRKQPWRLFQALGWFTVLRYVTGQLTLDQALDGLSQRLHLRIAAVHLANPQAALDIDRVADWQWAEQLLRLTRDAERPSSIPAFGVGTGRESEPADSA